MPFRRTLGKRKRTTRPVRRVRRRVAKTTRRIPRAPRSKAFLVKRTVSVLGGANTASSAGLTTSSPATGILQFNFGAATASAYFYAYSTSFSLSDLSATYADFTSLFDRYRINFVRVNLFPFANDPGTANTSASTGGVGCLIHSVIDYDDASAVAASDSGADTLRQYGNYRVQNMAQRRFWKRCLRPKLCSSIVNSAGTYQGNNVRKASYIDMANVSVPHYGMKLLFEFFSPTAAATVYDMKFEVMYYISCRDQR